MIGQTGIDEIHEAVFVLILVLGTSRLDLFGGGAVITVLQFDRYRLIEFFLGRQRTASGQKQ